MSRIASSICLTLASLILAGSASAQEAAARRSTIPDLDAIPQMPSRSVAKPIGKTVGSEWEVELPAEMANSRGIAAFRRTLAAVVKDASGVELVSVELGDRGTSGTTTRKALPEIPAGQEPVGLEYMPGAGVLWLATTSTAKDAGGMLFSSSFDKKGSPTGFKRQELPAAIKEVLSIKASGNMLAVVARENLGERGGIRIWGAPWLETRLGAWQSSDQLLTSREDFATLLNGTSMSVLGGTPEGRSAQELAEARESWSVRFGNEMISQWRVDPMRLPWPVEGPSATTAGPISILAGRMPKGVMADGDSSLTLLIAGEASRGQRGPWRPVVTNAAARRGAKLVVSESDSQLLVVGGKDASGRDIKTVASISIPRWADSISQEALEAEQREEEYLRARYALGRLTYEQAVELSRENNKYILTIIPAPGEEGRDFILKLGNPESAARKMLVGALINVRDDGTLPSGLPGKVQPSAGSSSAVLHTAGGTIISVMDSQDPTPEEIFQLTAPVRDPPGTHPAPSQ